MDVHLRAFDRLMAQPERNHGAVHAVLEQLHRSAVTQHMRCYALALERRAGDGSHLHMLANDAFDRIAAEPISTIAHEQRLVASPAALTKPHAERQNAVFPQRSRSLLSPLAYASHVRAGAERNIAAGQVDQLRHAKPCLQSEQKKHPISPARSGRWIGCPDERFDLRVGEIIDRPFLIPLGWHRQHLLAVMQELRFIDRDIREEGADRRQPCVAAARAIATPGLDEGQEVSNEVRIDIGDLERSWRPPQAIGGVFQQQAEGVSLSESFLPEWMRSFSSSRYSPLGPSGSYAQGP